MDSALSLRERIVDLGFTAFGRSRGRIRCRPSERTRTRPRLEGMEDRYLLSGISSVASYPIPSGGSAWYITTWAGTAFSGSRRVEPAGPAGSE